MADEKFINGWPVLRELGSGGQGNVYLVLHPDRSAAETKAIHDIDNALRQGGAIAQTPDQRIIWSMELARGVTEVTRPHRPTELGAANPKLSIMGEIHIPCRPGSAIASRPVSNPTSDHT